MSNKNCLKGLMCPECGHTYALDIQCTVIMRVTDDGTEFVNSNVEWDDNSHASCTSCGYDEQITSFRLPAFYVTFNTMTPESAKQGVFLRNGWWETGGQLLDDKPEEPTFEFDPDNFDPTVHATVADAVVMWATSLLKEGNCYFTGNEAWITEPEVFDCTRGESIERTFHPENFPPRMVERVTEALES